MRTARLSSTATLNQSQSTSGMWWGGGALPGLAFRRIDRGTHTLSGSNEPIYACFNTEGDDFVHPAKVYGEGPGQPRAPPVVPSRIRGPDGVVVPASGSSVTETVVNRPTSAGISMNPVPFSSTVKVAPGNGADPAVG